MKIWLGRHVFCVTAGLLSAVWLPITGPASTDDIQGCDCVNQVGNVNCDYLDQVDLSDLFLLIDHLYVSDVHLPNREEANIDGDPLGVVDLSDLTALIDHLFIGLQPLPDCPKPPNAPPQTTILGALSLAGEPFLNASAPGRASTGVRVQWRGSDLVDHPYILPEFSFEWRVYGPYESTGNSLGSWEQLRTRFIRQVLVVGHQLVVPFGSGATFDVCDTIPIVGPNGVELQIECQTLSVDQLTDPRQYGRIDTLLTVDDTNFLSDPVFNRIALSSEEQGSKWTYGTGTVAYDLYRHHPLNHTDSRVFVFWVRARDPVDSTVADIVPAFAPFNVIDPLHEHDVLVVDAQKSFGVNECRRDSTRAFWQQAIQSWRPEVGYLDSADYWIMSQSQGNLLPLELLVSHKVVIVTSDDSQKGVLEPRIREIAAAVDVGTNLWLCARSPLVGGEAAPPVPNIQLPAGYGEMFGVDSAVYSGWDWWWRRQYITNDTGLRIEDFTGAQPVLSGWPTLSIDTARLHRRYSWQTLVWIDSLAALPEVDFFIPAGDAEVLYTYNSLYGTSHFLGEAYSFQGLPVAIRYDHGNARTAHWFFTPLAFDEAEVQPAIDSMLTWLYPATDREK